MGVPKPPDIKQHLLKVGVPYGQVDNWVEFLSGLDWKWLRPVVKLAVNSHNHPAAAMATAAQFSQDDEFKAVAAKHLEARDHQPPEVEELVMSGERCPDCGCCTADECDHRACDTEGTGPQWCPCATESEEATT